MNLHKRVICPFSFFVFALNELKHKMKVKETIVAAKV